MKSLLLLLALVTLLSVIAYLLTQRSRMRKDDEPAWPFYARPVLSVPEQVLYHRLVSALPDHIVLAQVQLSRVLGVKKGFNIQAWNNRINRLSLDFLICEKDARVVAAIELDDCTHARSDRQEADARKVKALTAAGVPLLRWQATALPDVATIRQAILNSTGHVSTSSPAAKDERVARR